METEREKPNDDIEEEESLKQESTDEKPVNEDKQTVEQVRELFQLRQQLLQGQIHFMCHLSWSSCSKY